MKRLLMLLVLLMPALALAADEFVAEISPVVMDAGAKDAAFVCTIGNLYNSNTVGYYTHYVAGEEYAILFDPATCPVCGVGVQITRVRMLLRMPGGAFTVSCGLREAVMTAPGCYAPGAVVAASPVYSGTVATAGGYYINLPYVSDCATVGEKFFLTWTMVGASGVTGPYVDNDGALACNAYLDTGAGFADLSTAFVGDIFLWAEVDCCEPAVPNDDASWGSIKSLYR